MAADIREKLIGLLDYVEQVVRLDERVAFRLSEYRLPDGTTFAFTKDDTQSLPGIRHDVMDDDGPVWLEVERLTRRDPPLLPDDIADWVSVSSDPSKLPEIKSERIVTVSASERDEAIASGAVRPDDILEAPRKRGETEGAPRRFDLTLRLEDRPEISKAIQAWIDQPWTQWSTAEVPRRRTIALYQSLYKIFQLLESGGAESQIEVIWGIGVVDWQKDGRVIDRPLLERRVDIELDDKRGGLIRVRPAGGDAPRCLAWQTSCAAKFNAQARQRGCPRLPVRASSRSCQLPACVLIVRAVTHLTMVVLQHESFCRPASLLPISGCCLHDQDRST
jgi:hypothetical protein